MVEARVEAIPLEMVKLVSELQQAYDQLDHNNRRNI